MEQYQKILDLWKSYSIRSQTDLDRYLSSFRILFAYHSGKIENSEISYHDTREIFEDGIVSGFSGNPRALFEQQNQKLCYEFLKEKIVKKEPLSSELVLDIHPFADGNGRVGRTILNYYLMVHGHPPIIVYNEDKGSYYATLQVYDETEEIAPLQNFLQQQCEKTWGRTLKLAEGNDKGMLQGKQL